MGPGFTPEQGVHHRHFHRLGPNGVDGLRPPRPGNPLVAVRIEHAESQEAFGGHCGEE